MSGRKKAPSIATLDDCKYVASSNDVEVTVIRSADGKKSKVTIPLSSTLNALKDAINTNQTLGPIKRNQQRLFHLGRELKSGNRSLSALGIGKHNVFSIHLHSLAPKTVDLQLSDDGGEKKSSGRRRNKSKVVNNEDGDGVIDLASSGGGDISRNASNSQRHQQQQQQQQQREENQQKVVELLDSDSDDDDDAVEIIETETAPKRRRRT